MHIMEGFLPPVWCIFWYALAIPFIAHGVIRMKKITADNPEMKPLLAVCGAFIFIMSSLHVPSVTGSSSHPTGNGLGAVFFGATVISAICVPILLFQALLMAHGGISTLGANVFSMGVVGPFCAVFVWKLGRKLGLGYSLAIFLAAFVGDWMTYVAAATELGLAFPIPTFESAWIKMMLIYSYTQVPISIAESFLTVIIFEYIQKLRPDLLRRLNVLKNEEPNEGSKQAPEAN
jgi:cobalt/nickel transport system permease protein